VVDDDDVSLTSVTPPPGPTGDIAAAAHAAPPQRKAAMVVAVSFLVNAFPSMFRLPGQRAWRCCQSRERGRETIAVRGRELAGARTHTGALIRTLYARRGVRRSLAADLSANARHDSMPRAPYEVRHGHRCEADIGGRVARATECQPGPPRVLR